MSGYYPDGWQILGSSIYVRDDGLECVCVPDGRGWADWKVRWPNDRRKTLIQKEADGLSPIDFLSLVNVRLPMIAHPQQESGER